MPSNDSPSLHSAQAKPGGINRLFVLSWGIGLMTGVVASTIAVIGALELGYVSFGAQPASAQASGPAMPTPTELAASPTVLMEALVENTPTPTGTQAIASVIPVPATIVPNYAATATQACSSFNSRFPGTPCPRFNTPTPGP
jgi:hypothetical protein